MARYIDADALREKMFHEAFEKDSQDQKWDSGCWIRYHMFENVVDSIPTADVVEVVRCKECIYFEKGIFFGTCYKVLSVCGDEISTSPDWFCADGERREDGA